MRRIMWVLFLVGFLIGTNNVVATPEMQDHLVNGIAEEAQSDFEVSVSVDFMSKYLGTAGVVYEDDPVVQPGMSFDHISGLSLSVWGSFGTENEDGDEVDYLVSYAQDLEWGISVEVGGGYWDFNKMFQGRVDNVWDIYVQLSCPIEFLDLEIYAKSDGMFMEPDSSFEGGFNQYLGARKEAELGALTVAVDAYLVYDDGVFGTQPCTSAQYRLGADYEVSSGLTIGPRFAVSLPFNPNKDDGREREFIWGVGLSYTF